MGLTSQNKSFAHNTGYPRTRLRFQGVVLTNLKPAREEMGKKLEWPLRELTGQKGSLEDSRKKGREKITERLEMENPAELERNAEQGNITEGGGQGRRRGLRKKDNNRGRNVLR